MRISNNFVGNYTSANQTLAQTQNAQSSDNSSYSISSTLLGNSLFNKANYVSSDSTSTVKDATGQMKNDPKAMEMRMHMNSTDETSTENRQKMKALMDNMATTDLDEMSEDEKRALLEDVTSTISELRGANNGSVDVSGLSSDEVNKMLDEIQTKAIEGPKGKDGPGGPGGPGGPPPGGKQGSVSASSETDTESTTLQALLDALAADEEDESTSDDESTEANASSIQQNAFKAAINQYMKSQNWDVDDLKSMFEL